MLPIVTEVQGGIHRLFYIKTDKFKYSSITVFLCVPEKFRNVAYETLLLAVLQRGTKKHNNLCLINRYLDNLYSMEVSTRRYSVSDNCFIGVTCEFLDKKYVPEHHALESEALDFSFELLFEPLFDDVTGCFLEKYVENEKISIINSLNAQKNSTRSYASLRCRELLCHGEAGQTDLSELIKQISEISSEELTEYYHAVTDMPNLLCFYIGNDPDAAKISFEKNIESKLDNFNPLPKRLNLRRYALPEKIKRESEKMRVSQCKLSVGYRTDIKADDGNDVYAMQVLCELFGGGPSSRLFTVVREKLGLCYYCSASYSMYSGILMVNSGIYSHNREQAERQIDAELKAVSEGEITENEINAAKLSLKFSYTQIADSTASIENFYFWRALTMPGVSADDVINGIMSVTAEDIKKVAKHIKKGAVFFIEATEESDATDAPSGDDDYSG